MIYRVDSKSASILTREKMSLAEWENKLEGFISMTEFVDCNELIKSLKADYNLIESQVSEVENLINNLSLKHFRYSCTKYEHFKIEPVYLELTKNKGKLIYWRDWDFIFQKIDNDYFLWCFLGGIADIQREIKLSNEQVEKYYSIGEAQIDYMIASLKKLNNSDVYEEAIRENRRVL
jgi:hypothetical protein